MKNKQEEKRQSVAERVENAKAFVRNKKQQLHEFRTKRRQKKFENGEVDLPVFRVGPNKKGVIALWALMGASLVFGVYKNFTAIDKETIYETTVVEAEVTDTNAVESFVERFAYLYHAWGKGQSDRSSRQEALGGYMTEELVNVNNNAVNSDCPTVAEVENVRICEVTDLENGDFEVRYSVVQKLTETIDAESMASVVKKELPVVATSQQTEAAEPDSLEDTGAGETTGSNEFAGDDETVKTADDVVDAGAFEGTQTGETAEDIAREDMSTENMEDMTSGQESEVQKVRTGEQAGIFSVTTVEGEDGTTTITRRESFYMVTVHMDETGCMVITKNPTACGIYGKSAYSPKQYQNDSSIGTEMTTDIQDFLNTFFNLYPTATEKELVYYAAPGTMDVINADFVYDGLSGTTIYKEDGQIKAHVYVRYLDQTAKMMQLSEYTLTLEKGDNWKIIKAE